MTLVSHHFAGTSAAFEEHKALDDMWVKLDRFLGMHYFINFSELGAPFSNFVLPDFPKPAPPSCLNRLPKPCRLAFGLCQCESH